MSIYQELVMAAQTVGFTPRTPEESDSAHLMRLVLAVNTVPDRVWATLTAQAVSWCNEAATQLSADKPLERCSGFGSMSPPPPPEPERGQILDFPESKPIPVPAEVADFGKKLNEALAAGQTQVVEEFRVAPEILMPPRNAQHATAEHVEEVEVPSQVPAENIALDTGSADSAQAPDLSGLGKTDLIRAFVIQHPDWSESQIKQEMGDTIKKQTVATVRSVTLATIAVAKRLGKWVD